MNFDFLNFLPGYKRAITVVVATVLFGWHEAFANEIISFDVPSVVYGALAIFGYNAIAQAPKNTP